jgi:hypothetical protein
MGWDVGDRRRHPQENFSKKLIVKFIETQKGYTPFLLHYEPLGQANFLGF